MIFIIDTFRSNVCDYVINFLSMQRYIVRKNQRILYSLFFFMTQFRFPNFKIPIEKCIEEEIVIFIAEFGAKRDISFFLWRNKARSPSFALKRLFWF